MNQQPQSTANKWRGGGKQKGDQLKQRCFFKSTTITDGGVEGGGSVASDNDSVSGKGSETMREHGRWLG